MRTFRSAATPRTASSRDPRRSSRPSTFTFDNSRRVRSHRCNATAWSVASVASASASEVSSITTCSRLANRRFTSSNRTSPTRTCPSDAFERSAPTARPLRSATRVSVASCSPAPDSSQSSRVTSMNVAPRRSAAVSRTRCNVHRTKRVWARSAPSRSASLSTASKYSPPRSGVPNAVAPSGGSGGAGSACVAGLGTISCSRVDRGDELDLHRDVEGELGEADGGPRVTPGVAEHLHEQVGAPVDDGGCPVESGRDIDHAEHLHDAADAVQVAELGTERREDRARRHAGRLHPLLERHVPSDLAGDHPVAGDGTVPTDVDEPTLDHAPHVVPRGREHGRELDPELHQPVVDPPHERDPTTTVRHGLRERGVSLEFPARSVGTHLSPEQRRSRRPGMCGRRSHWVRYPTCSLVFR